MPKILIQPVVSEQAATVQSPSLGNATGTVIPTFSVVALNAQGALVLARSNSPATSTVVGVADGDIGAGESVRVSVGGVVGYSLDPASDPVAAGITLYLSPNVAGHVTASKPTAPNLVVILGKAIGDKLLLDISSPAEVTTTLETDSITNSTAAEIPAFSAVALLSDGSMVPADASDEDRTGVLGFVTTAVPAGLTGKVRFGGTTSYRYESGANPPAIGNKLFLSDSEAGTVTSVPPTAAGSVVLPLGTLAGSNLAIEINRGITLSS